MHSFVSLILIHGQLLAPPTLLGELYQCNDDLVIRDVETNALLDSFNRGWDYNEDVGLIMAGSVAPDSRIVELTTDGGQTFEHLADIPWGRPSEEEIAGPCAVILGRLS